MIINKTQSSSKNKFSPKRCIQSLELMGAKIDDIVRDLILSSTDISPKELLQRFKNRTSLRENQIYRSFSDAIDLPFIDIDWMYPDKELLKLLPIEEWQRLKAVPLTQISNIIEVAMADPLDVRVAILLEEKYGYQVSRMCAVPSQIDSFLSKEAVDVYEIQQNFVSFSDIDMANFLSQIERGDLTKVSELGKQIIVLAQKLKASDIHIEPLDGEARVRLRIDGLLREYIVLSKKIELILVSYFKVASQLDIAEKRLPQDGRMSMDFGAAAIDMRISTTPVLNGEKICIRILDQSAVSLDLDSLTFSKKILSSFKNVLASPNGMFIVTGPTGSGKTTTLYAALSEIANPALNITTIEDPVEFHLGGINQIQINKKIGLDFPKVLRSVLRQDPDIILIGEIRDKETAQIAIKAALTGHLVLTTLHTNTALEAVIRLQDIGVPSYLISQAVIGSMGQRLIRRLCSHCKESWIIDDVTKEKLSYTGNEELIFYKEKGCEHCGYTGFTGRVPVQELFVCNNEAKKVISRNSPMDNLESIATNYGYKPLHYDALLKAMMGLTTLDEVFRIYNGGMKNE